MKAPFATGLRIRRHLQLGLCTRSLNRCVLPMTGWSTKRCSLRNVVSAYCCTCTCKVKCKSRQRAVTGCWASISWTNLTGQFGNHKSKHIYTVCVCILDNTHNTTSHWLSEWVSHGLPWFVLSVPTNCGYVIADVVSHTWWAGFHH